MSEPARGKSALVSGLEVHGSYPHDPVQNLGSFFSSHVARCCRAFSLKVSLAGAHSVTSGDSFGICS